MNKSSENILISCPKCGWEPDGKPAWKCSVCNTKWNTFDTHGECPACGKVYEKTACINCKQWSYHEDWYVKIEAAKPKSSSLFFWRNTDELPITQNDKQWVEHTLSYIEELFGKEKFDGLTTVIPEKQFFDMKFKGTEDDVNYIFERLSEILQVNTWEIILMYYSERPTRIANGIIATPSDKLHGGWSGSSSKYFDKGFGQKEIWLEIELLHDPERLIAVLAHELVRYKLTNEYNLDGNDELFTALVTVSYGFGIFMGNSYFKFKQWTGSSHQGWRMQKRGFLPEQIIAYSMAWLARYRDEDISWKKYFNKTMLKYFDKCYKYLNNAKAV